MNTCLQYAEHGVNFISAQLMCNATDMQYSTVCLREAASQAERLQEEEDAFLGEFDDLLGGDPWEMATSEHKVPVKGAAKKPSPTTVQDAWTWLDDGSIGSRTRAARNKFVELVGGSEGVDATSPETRSCEGGHRDRRGGGFTGTTAG